MDSDDHTEPGEILIGLRDVGIEAERLGGGGGGVLGNGTGATESRMADHGWARRRGWNDSGVAGGVSGWSREMADFDGITAIECGQKRCDAPSGR
ncbi:MAG: hypothetical protein JNK85_07000 [Verrucomicrobiales bacterium]|nr:hypothetical protein [Verrucomicrobiales bacterium]